MSELKVHKAYNRWIDEEMPTPNDDLICNEFYLKSEADKVIAELKEKLDLYKRGWAENDKIIAYLCAELNHNKHKRCLAVARRCHNESLWWYSKGYRFEKYDKFWEKWENRWLELAEKFKEADNRWVILFPKVSV
jgi:hypothetical protein